MSMWRVLLACIMLVAAASQPDPKHFHYFAEVSTPEANQAWFTVTPEIWRNATSDLRDLRLYDGPTQVPYLLAPGSSEEVRGSQRDATILNLGTANGATQFVVDTHQGDTRAPFDSVQLTLRDDAPDFVAAAQVEGFNRFEDTPVSLGKSTLFKLEREKLGVNLSVKFRPVVFRYVRITVPSIDPRAVVGAHVFSPAKGFGWTELPVNAPASVQGKDSIFEWDAIDTVPIGRVTFISDTPKEFWRRVDIVGEHDSAIASGSIWSIKSHVGNEQSTNLEVVIPGEARSQHFKVIVHNGDDPSLNLKIGAAYRERRVYFTPPHAGTLRLYFGDAELERPTYDYAQTHGIETDAGFAITAPAEQRFVLARATVGNVSANPGYTPRPDKRPWSEQHQAVIWIALGVAVVGLGAVALKSFKK
jgi:hypothetical protein